MSKRAGARALALSVVVIAVALLASSPLLAQTGRKVLFDAGHSQMAGNADWVVDEDTCGSPQRFPTPAQSGITASTAETYWNGGYSAFGVDLAKAGYQIETLPPGVPITYGVASNVQDLSNYDVFIVPEPNVRFSDSEKGAILAFVQDGGGLFMIADHGQSDRNNDGWDSPEIFNDLGSDSLFGIHFQVEGEANTNIVDHPDSKYTADPNSVIVKTGPAGALTVGKGLGIFNGTTFVLNTTVNPNAKGHIWATAGTADTATQVTFATSTYGAGRVAAIGDSSPSEDATNSCGHTTYKGWNETAYDNAKVHLNAIAWLAAGTACTDTTAPIATVTAPTATTVSGSVTISATGTDNVAVTGMTLSIDGVQVATSTVSAIAWTWNATGLAAGSSHTISVTARDACGNVSPAATKSVTIAGAATYSIAGSAGTASATISAGTTTATADASGNYTLAGLAAGTYAVTPSKSGCTFSPASLSVTVGPSATGKSFTATCGTTGDTALTSGVTLTGQTVALKAWKYYYVDVAAGTTSLTLATTAATGDVDIYTQSGGVKPTSTSYVCRPYGSTGNETCTAASPAAGRWYLGVYGYAAATFSVTATVVTSAPTYSIAGNAGTAGATLTAGAKSATSDAASAYSIAGLAAGTYTVTPSKSGCTFSPVSLSVTVGPNATAKNFTASCGGGATTLFTDGFESAGWSFANVSGTTGYWTLGASSTHPSASPHGGTRLAAFNSYTAAAGVQKRMYRAAGFAVASSFTSVSLKFWMYHDPAYSTSADKVQVQVSTNGTTWTNAGTAVARYAATAGWTQSTVDLSAYKGQTVYLAFLGISAYGNDVYLDDVTVTGQ
ncbi:MAG: choice-of-anchor J domain-containing protein [Holophagales bacterium]|nr:choice-of-anchor J domain-containing protein [Holophagales bacterium]